MASPSSKASPAELPLCRLLVRSKKGVELFNVSSSRQAVSANGSAPPSKPQAPASSFLLQGSTSLQQLSPDGRAVYFHVADRGIAKCSLDPKDNGSPPAAAPFLEDSQGVQMLDVSPSGAYLLTWERWNAETRTDNLRVWSASTGRRLAGFSQKSLKRESWPYLQWTADERYALLQTSSEIRVYLSDAFSSSAEGDEVRYTDRLRIQGIQTMSLSRSTSASNASPSSCYYFTSFCPGTKDKPARASLHEFDPNKKQQDRSQSKGGGQYPSIMSKSLFQAEECTTHWNATGDAALITLQTSVDASGESYYGSSQLFLLAPKSNGNEVRAVELPQEGPVLDVAWIPAADKPACFVAVAGKMPAMASLHHGQTGRASFLFGNAHRNCVAFSPHGRFLCLAGFGNLAGGMGFWDRNKTKLVPHCPANAAGNLRADAAVVGYGWSPDSRLFFVSTCSPRMNVDNGIQLFRYTGEEVSTVPWNNDDYRPDRLLEVRFVPASSPDLYPDRPQSPVPEQQPQPSAGGGNSLAERMRREREGNMQGATRVGPGTRGVGCVRNAVTGQVIPGLAVEPAAGKSKSALKREKAKLKKKQQQEQQEARQQQQEQPKQQEGTASPQQPQAVAAAAVDPEKRARKLKKTLKQIDELKQKDPASLNEDQRAKVESEDGLRAELAGLGV